jgi:hypothetical protein
MAGGILGREAREGFWQPSSCVTPKIHLSANRVTGFGELPRITWALHVLARGNTCNRFGFSISRRTADEPERPPTDPQHCATV